MIIEDKLGTMGQADFLRTMMTMQRQLQVTAMGYDFDSMSPRDRTTYIKEMSIHANQEMNEMLYELPFFKPWKDYTKMTEEDIEDDFKAARKELIDHLHFFMNMAIGLNMTADELFTGYYQKNKENYQRQMEGYTHDKQYR
jgi:dimeric dUTPase (all-alpha-NTP-PPase superfamily)